MIRPLAAALACLAFAVRPSSALPSPVVLVGPHEVDADADADAAALCAPDAIYANGTCVKRCADDNEVDPNSIDSLQPDDECLRCPPESTYSRGRCVRCSAPGLALDARTGRCACAPGRALLDGACVQVRVHACRAGEALSATEGRCVPLYCYGRRCCRTALCNACFESCRQLRADTPSLSRCQNDCINDIAPSMPPFPVTPEPNFEEPIVVDRPSQPIFVRPDPYPPMVVSRPSLPVYNPPQAYPPIVVSRPSQPVYSPPSVYRPTIVSRPMPPVPMPQPAPPPPMIQPQPIIMRPPPPPPPRQQPVIVLQQQQSRPSQIITTSAKASNSSNVVDLTNIVNSTNVENVHTRVNNTNVNRIRLGSSSSSSLSKDYEISVNGEEGGGERVVREECCVVLEPRRCINESDRVVCYHRRRHVCGEECLSSSSRETETDLIDIEREIAEGLAVGTQMAAYYRQPQIQQPAFVPQPMYAYQQPMMYQSFQPPQMGYLGGGGAGCNYTPQWPYLRC